MTFADVKPGDYFLWPNGDLTCRRMTTYGVITMDADKEPLNAIDMADCQPIYFADNEVVEALPDAFFTANR